MTEHDSHSHLIDEPTARLIRAARPTHFAAGFAERVTTRLAAEREYAIANSLERQFVRIVPLMAAASLLLAAFNWVNARDASVSAFDAALNLPQVTLSAAYSSSWLFGTADAPVGAP